jgi:asparagine synthase (glutamine-hydrolysing)
VRDGRIESSWQFYELPLGDPRDDITFDEAVEQTRSAISAAVERQMVSDVPVGAFLSGGLDSSAVVSFARRHAKDGRLKCFTIAHRGQGTAVEGIAEDLPYAKRVAAHLNVDLEVVEVGPEMLADLPQMVRQLDEPLADLAPLNVAYIAKAARAQGIPVLLSGAGGDDIFTGYRRHLSLAYERAWSWLPGFMRSGMHALSSRLPTRRPLLRRAAKVLSSAHQGADERIVGYFNWIDPKTGNSLLAGEAAHASAQSNGAHEDVLLDAVRRLPQSMPRMNRMLYLDAKYFLVDHNLNYTDKMSMQHGVEVRVPLLDQELIRVASTFPVSFKQGARWGKRVFRKAMTGILPDDVIYRSKSGFGVPLRAWMRQGLGPVMDDLLSTDAISRRGVYSAPAVKALAALDRAGQVDAAYPLLSVACVELWCREYLDR